MEDYNTDFNYKLVNWEFWKFDVNLKNSLTGYAAE